MTCTKRSGSTWTSKISVEASSRMCKVCPRAAEAAERRLDSYSQCLDELSPGQVIAAADQALAAAKR